MLANRKANIAITTLIVAAFDMLICVQAAFLRRAYELELASFRWNINAVLASVIRELEIARVGEGDYIPSIVVAYYLKCARGAAQPPLEIPCNHMFCLQLRAVRSASVSFHPPKMPFRPLFAAPAARPAYAE